MLSKCKTLSVLNSEAPAAPSAMASRGPTLRHLFDLLPDSSHSGLRAAFQTSQTHSCLKALEAVLPSARITFLHTSLLLAPSPGSHVIPGKPSLAAVFRPVAPLPP